MDKIYNNWKKIIAAASVLAIASVGAPQGAHAVNFDKIEIGDMIINDESGIVTGNPEKNIYGEFQIAFQNTENESCDAAKTYWLNNNSHHNYKEAMIQTVVPQGTAPTSGTPKRLNWYFGLGGSPHINAVNIFNFSATGPELSVSAAFNNTASPTNRTQYSLQWRVHFVLSTSSNNGNYAVGDGMYISVSCSNVSTATRLSSSLLWWNNGAENADGRPVWIRNLTINYPDGYDGPTIPTTYAPPIPAREDTPNIVLRSVNNWKGQFSDDNFLTFDAVPFTCDQGLAPVIQGEVWDERSTPVLLDTFEANATGLFNITFPEDSSEADYRIVSWYVCDDGINVFSDAAHYSFTITGYGQLKNESLFETCIDANFPFLHPDDCLENMFIIINMLKFGEVNFGGNWNSPTSCYTLTHFDDWINRPGQVVCPAVKESVRVLITPVVLFLLALAMVRIINRHNGERP